MAAVGLLLPPDARPWAAAGCPMRWRLKLLVAKGNRKGTALMAATRAALATSSQIVLFSAWMRGHHRQSANLLACSVCIGLQPLLLVQFTPPLAGKALHTILCILVCQVLHRSLLAGNTGHIFHD